MQISMKCPYGFDPGMKYFDLPKSHFECIEGLHIEFAIWLFFMEISVALAV